MSRTALRKAGLLLTGLVMGLFGLALGLWFYLQAARVEEIRSEVGADLQLAQDAIERIEVLEEDALRFTLRDVAVLDSAGDTIMAAPRVMLTLDLPSMSGEGPIEFYDVVLQEPYARLFQAPDGSWNFADVVGMTAAGEPVGGGGRALLFRSVRVENGRMVLAMPAPPAEQASSAGVQVQLPLTSIGGVSYRVYAMDDVQATLPLLRVGGPQGWRAEMASFSGELAEPNIRIAQAEGWAQQAGDDGVSFELAALRFGGSSLAGGGTIRFAEGGTLFDFTVQATTLLAADLRPLLPGLPEEGVASFALGVQSVTAERVALTFDALDVSLGASRVLGSLGVALGGDLPLALTAAALELAPLELSTLEQLGVVTELPFLGRIAGRVTTAGARAGFADVDLSAALTPRNDPSVPQSTVFATGEVALGGPAEPLRLDGLALSFQPLHLAALRQLAPEQADQLRGELRGSVTLGGTLERVQLAGGDLAYEVGDAPPTRLTQLTGEIALDPLAYDLRVVADPIALGTLTELFPALPFRSGTLSGEILIAGNRAGFSVESDLSGPSGGIQFAGSVELGEVVTVNLQGNLRAFAAGMILRPEVPVEGPLTGTFSVRGTSRRLGFNVDLAQADGSFALTGTANFGNGPVRFDVAGNIVNFRIGALLGDPRLFPDPMSGPIAIAGGGGAPYTFNIDLEGPSGRFDLRGVYRQGTVPSYEIQGIVAGLDVGALPFGPALPATELNGRVDIRGQGMDLETLAGTYDFDLGASRVANLALDTALGSIEVVDGIAQVDTLFIALENSRLAASGSWGLRSPAAEPLRFALSSPDLSALSRVIAPDELIPPALAGSVDAQGVVGGSVEYPLIEGELTGADLRYEDWRAATLEVTADVQRDPLSGWGGQLSLTGDDLVIPNVQDLQTVRVEASGNESALAVGLFARRDAASDLALSGILELAGMRPEGIALETMTVRADGMRWDLLEPARVRYVSDEGILIQNLQLQREGGGDSGLLTINGIVPPTGNADLQVLADNVDLADLNRLAPTVPAVDGLLSMNLLLNGPVANPGLSITGEIRELVFEGVETERVVFDASYSGQLLDVNAEATIGGRPLFVADGSIPMLLSLEDRLIPAIEFSGEAPLTATIEADSLPLDVAAAMLPGITQGAGLARAQILVGGTLDAPTLSGWARIDDGAITIERLGARYTEIQADLELGESRATINTFSARSGGTIVGSGSVGFPSVTEPLYELSFQLDGFRVMNDPEVAELTASGEVVVTGPASEPVITGQLRIHESTIYVPRMGQEQPVLELAYADVADFARATDANVTVAPPLMGDVRIDNLRLAFRESVWLESPEMQVQIEGDLVVYRTGEDLRVFGALQALRGTYLLEISAIVREFDVIQGNVQFFGTGQLDPSLDILAGYPVRTSTLGQGGDLTILVHLTGTLLSPRLQLTADTPVPLSEADLISYLMFGQPSFELGGVTETFAQQLFVQEVVGGILATEFERSVRSAGLCDWFQVRPGVTTSFQGLLAPGALSTAAIECGWELAPSLFLTAQANLGGLVGNDFTNGQIGMEWQIDQEWAWEATYGAVPRDAIFRIFDASIRTQFSTDLRRQWEYGKPRDQPGIDLSPTDPDGGRLGPSPPPAPEILTPPELPPEPDEPAAPLQAPEPAEPPAPGGQPGEPGPAGPAEPVGQPPEPEPPEPATPAEPAEPPEQPVEPSEPPGTPEPQPAGPAETLESPEPAEPPPIPPDPPAPP